MNNNILVVDDSQSICELVANTLEKYNYNVFTRNNGKEGYDFLAEKKENIALIVSDINMPVMNGIEFVRKIRSDSEYRFVPILILTTESQHKLKLEAKKAGATGWIVKPFQEEKFIGTIKKLLGS